jgi:hypothetical protein
VVVVVLAIPAGFVLLVVMMVVDVTESEIPPYGPDLAFAFTRLKHSTDN